MANRKLNIGGEVFTVVRPRNTSIKVSQKRAELRRNSFIDIYDAYERPSITKVNIWYSWLNWSINVPFPLYITSRNFYFFTLETIWIDNEDNWYLLRITAKNQIAIPMIKD